MTFSVEVLSRFAKAGVEMITVAMGQAIFSNFKLRPDAQLRFSDAIAKLKAFSSYGQVLWFGFGVKHIVKILAETEQGIACAAMCACLSVSYDTLFNSKVLKALSDQRAAPDTLTPSLSQWGVLIKACAGAVGNSTFPKLVEGISRLFSPPDLAETSEPWLNKATTPEALARALLEIEQVSKGNVRSVTFIGGIDCGWLASVSQWLLSLSVDITDELGSLVYRHRSSYCPSYPQVVIVRMLRDASQNTVMATLKQRSFLISPGQLCFDPSDQSQHIFSAGRSEWASILHDTFGDSIDVLLSPENVVGFANFLYGGFSKMDPNGSSNVLNPWGGVFATAREKQFSFMSFASQRLPELVTVFRTGELRPPHAGFCIVNKDQILPDDLRKICPCSMCKSGIDDSTCLESIGISVLFYIWILSWLDIDETIYPSSTGLLKLYYSDLPRDIRQLPTSEIEDAFFKTFSISFVMRLFTGLDYPSTDSEAARSGGGVCVYLSSLKNPTTAPMNQLRMAVVPGQIERRGSLFEVVVDKMVEDIGISILFDIIVFIREFGCSPEMSLLVDETLDSYVLEAYLLISRNPNEQQMEVHSPFRAHLHQKMRSGFAENGPAIMPSRIRQAITQNFSVPNCASRITSLNAFSVKENQFVYWTGPCHSAQQDLWTDTVRNIQLCPGPDEWVLSSTPLSPNRGILCGGLYILLYTTICSIGRKGVLLSTSVSCLLCQLASEGLISADLQRLNVFMFSIRDRKLSIVNIIKGQPSPSESEVESVGNNDNEEVEAEDEWTDGGDEEGTAPGGHASVSRKPRARSKGI